MPDYASLVFLSYQRPNFIFEAIRSATQNAGHPCEVIVHDDGSTAEGVQVGLLDMLAGGEISRLVLNVPRHNEGVGVAMNRGFKLATGDPIFKLDQDMLYEPDWLARAVGILRQDLDVGMLGLFRYHHEPVIWEDKRINVATKGGYHYTRQFCGSGFALPRRVWEELKPFDQHLDAFNEDSNFMETVRASGRELALPDVDLATNRGFGIGPSTVVEEGYKVHEIHHGTYVLNEKTPPPPTEVISPPSDAKPPSEADSGTPQPETSASLTPPSKFNVGVVITSCAGREENLRRVIDHLMRLDVTPHTIVVVYDGCPAMGFDTPVPIQGIEIPKHAPGQEQPRNVGFRRMREIDPGLNFCWFLDSDMIFEPDILKEFWKAHLQAEDRILIGPYDWLQKDVIAYPQDQHDLSQVGLADCRWASFEAYGPDKVFRHDLGTSLANFGGNLIWPVEPFEYVGGYHPDLHHGRCEDGELGLRAGSAGIPMSLVRAARAWHVWHEVDLPTVLEKNRRDVPLLNSWHPWIEQEGYLMTEGDGARFEWTCPRCNKLINLHDSWTHRAGPCQ